MDRDSRVSFRFYLHGHLLLISRAVCRFADNSLAASVLAAITRSHASTGLPRGFG